MNAPVDPKLLESVSLDDKYTHDSGTTFMTGTQALVRLPMLQRQRDAAAGLNTAGFISGYRGSPLGMVDQAVWKAGERFRSAGIRFVPAVNEELAATALCLATTVILKMSLGAAVAGAPARSPASRTTCRPPARRT